MKQGDLINERYQITEKLGQGAFAAVFLAIDSYTDEKVAIKTVPAEVTYESHMLDEFRDNYKLVHHLHHPHIAAYKTLEKDHVANQFFLVMEYVEGSDLSRYRKQQPNRLLSLEKLLELLIPVAQALDHAHQKGVAHRDIKPENIRINSMGQAKILDFGLAAQIKSTVIRRSQTPEMFNSELAGTRPYMAPELLKAVKMKDNTLKAADRYAFGAMCYELLDGVLPFESDDFTILKDAICNEPVEPIETLSEEQNSIITKLLAKDPGERFETTVAFINALEQTITEAKQIFTATGRSTMGDDDSKKICIRRAEIDAVTRLLEQTSPLEMRSHSTVEFGELTADELIARIDGSIQIIEKSAPFIDKDAFCITLKAKRSEKASIKAPTTGTFKISSEPEGSKIYLNGHYYGQTPQTIKHEAETLELILKKPDYHEIQETLRLQTGQTLELPFSLTKISKTGMLLIDSQPEGAKWYLNEQWQGQTPDKAEISAGKHQIAVKQSGYEDWWQTLDIDPAKTQRLEAKLIKIGPKPGDEWQDPITGIEFVWVPKGEFMMGSPKSDEDQHKVRLTQGFWLGKYPVTQGQWKKIMNENPSCFTNGDNYPVEKVSWNDVKSYISQLNGQGKGGFRLPTEAQWEYACRSGGKDEKWAGCNNESQLSHYAWYDDNSGGKTHPVGQKKPNGLGLYDMSGNVFEWVEDWHGDYPSGTVTDPQGPSSGSYRVYRGGSWFNDASFSRSALRLSSSPDFRGYDLGFRLSRT